MRAGDFKGLGAKVCNFRSFSRGRLGPNLLQAEPSQTKKNQEKPRKAALDSLGFSWISSSDSRLFKGLRASQSKEKMPTRAKAIFGASGRKRKIRRRRIVIPKAARRSLRGPSPVPPCRRSARPVCERRRQAGGFEGAGHSVVSFRRRIRTNIEHLYRPCKKLSVWLADGPAGEDPAAAV
jgi:hypothetical protein